MFGMFRALQKALLLTPVLMVWGPCASAASTDWRDVDSRVQYAWYTEDTRDLNAVATRVADAPEGDPLRGYYLTLIQLRLAQVAQARTREPDVAGMGRAAGSCVGFADDALAVRPTDAELLALQSLCMDVRSQTRSMDVTFASSRARTQMQRALTLAPRNPRVQLLAAQLAYMEAKSVKDRAAQLPAFQSAVDAFELERQGMERLPSWGAAEAWQGLAQVYLDRGDAVAARSALEHALLLMPDFKSAHRLLNHILTG